MPERPKTLGERTLIWTQIVAIVGAGVWAVCTFGLKEVLEPTATVNLALNLELKKIEVKDSQKGLIPVELKATATNPSKHNVYLFWDGFSVKGVTVEARTNVDGEKLLKEINDGLSATNGYIVFTERHIENANTVATVVAAGQLFRYDWLAPGETVTGSRIIYIPTNTYDELSADLFMAYTALKSKQKKGADLTLVATNDPDFKFMIFLKGKPVSDEYLKKLRIVGAESCVGISLWR